MAHANALIGSVDYRVDVTSGRHSLVCDEPTSLGGAGAGFAPYDLLLASLGACTAITLRMYAQRKQWSFRSLNVELHYSKDGDRALIERVITVDGELDDEQRERMLQIAAKTPVTLTLKSGADIQTRFAPSEVRR